MGPYLTIKIGTLPFGYGAYADTLLPAMAGCKVCPYLAMASTRLQQGPLRTLSCPCYIESYNVMDPDLRDKARFLHLALLSVFTKKF